MLMHVELFRDIHLSEYVHGYLYDIRTVHVMICASPPVPKQDGRVDGRSNCENMHRCVSL